MVDVIDSTQTITITLLLEGKATITNITAPSTVHAGSTFDVSVTIRNDGQTTDTLFASLTDVATGTLIGARQQASLAVGGTQTFTWTGIVMPNRDLTIRVDAGHVE
jgi:hypothetical protein